MSDPALDIEESEQDSSPRELVQITHGSTTYRIATGTRDISYGGNVYTATAASRGELGVTTTTDPEKELTITLPIDHAFVRRYLQQGVPPRQITATVLRYYSASVVEQLWVGEITAMSVDDRNTEATFRVPSRLGQSLVRRLPTITAGRLCPHMLYDDTCAIDRNGTNPDGIPYKLSTTVLHVSGREVRLDLSSVPVGNAHRSDWLVGGELVHTASGERMTIREQNDLNPGGSTVTVISMHLQIPVMKLGDNIEVYAGCKWDVTTCDQKFNNLPANGSYPYMPTGNPYVPGTLLKEE